jgi:hypothetical protein
MERVRTFDDTDFPPFKGAEEENDERDAVSLIGDAGEEAGKGELLMSTRSTNGVNG